MTKSLPFEKLKKNKTVLFLLALLFFIFLMGLYAPFFASSKPFFVYHEKKIYFPLFRFLFYKNAYTQPLDLFFNAWMFTFPLAFLSLFLKKRRKLLLIFFVIAQLFLFCFATLSSLGSRAFIYQQIDEKIAHLDIQKEEKASIYYVRPPIHYHWQQSMLTKEGRPSIWNPPRVNGQNLLASLLFGLRYSFSLAFLSCLLALLVGTFFGALAGFLGGWVDLLISRLIEVWESLPTLIVLLLLVAITQKTNFLFVAFTLALFSWTSIARLVRIEMFKQKHLAYIEVLKNMEMPARKILLKHLLPNCFWMLLSLMPQAFIGAITYESALSFLGLGDGNYCSMGLLLDEARMAYPMQNHLFWPPALLLILLLILLTWLGDTFRKVLDPKLNEDPF